ncbi:hypothetical protein NA57DRAFT_39326 [Rhizodiscina lignyota]|uniref:R3H-associated N-terminal domain-containing protein n=1 Tax=Rhizodiscina lignyota TaxID=1504668 RepID=A0A9P4IGJ3_9PEZI|nr:hypothetical protein NA57DRAFT_39326 [Rhizodiscina lignyota]
MAIHPSLPLSNGVPLREPIDIEEWTERAVESLSGLAISGGPVGPIRGTSVTLEIPLDDHDIARKPSSGSAEGAEESAKARLATTPPRRREPLRRDSLKRREALLRGKEGSRRRQRWENDRLLNNPYAQPPLPSDWEVHPTHPVHVVPYYLAPLWDSGFSRQHAERTTRARTARADAQDESVRIPKEVREKLKRARGAKGLLQDLEEEVRVFVQRWDEGQRKRERDLMIEPDSDEDEVVFVGRNGQMSDMPDSRRTSEELEREKLVFDSLEDDHGASFGRWLVHSIGAYYGLNTWSRTVGNPARREAYVGIKESKLKSGRKAAPNPLPRPLYGLV